MKNAIIISNKFNFGHLSGIMGWHYMLSNIGYNVMILGDNEYGKSLKKSEYRIIRSIDELISCEIAIIFNISTKDNELCKKLKDRYKSIKILFIYHEPWRGFKNELQRFHKDYKNLLKQIGRSYYSRKILKQCSLVICPSLTGFDYYKLNEFKFNSKCVVFPLVFVDDCKLKYKKDKKFVSFISTASRDKAFDKYIEFVKYSYKKNLNLNYQIVTQTNISSYLDSEIKDLISQNRLVVKHGIGLSEETMNEAYNSSIVTWLAYRSSTQSGVIGKSFMWASPCVATGVGIFSDIVNGKNGILIQDVDNYEEIYKAVCLIIENKLSFFENARLTFEELYDSAKKTDDLLKIINML